ncbi:acid-shock protein [Phyllobacterium sp. 628]|uniref:EF-hand domain-containing protein n=1 Tax=Phyllobacterium sp. 628 TaxID=2718938 RepID=UPI001662607B|nr:acid-shock protein [Phyllobacterium sp. 628]QND50907.1 acid-shock protein [Phyllobacterium sp. 628]
MKSRLATIVLTVLPLSLIAPVAMAAPKADTNGDGMISLDEYQTAARTRLLKFDTNGDGKLSLEEWLKRPVSKNATRDPTDMFKRFDTNHDGFVDAAEMDAASKKRFDRLDKNSDGQLSKDERPVHKKKNTTDSSQE